MSRAPCRGGVAVRRYESNSMVECFVPAAGGGAARRRQVKHGCTVRLAVFWPSS